MYVAPKRLGSLGGSALGRSAARLVEDDERAGDFVAEALMLLAEDEEPVDRPKGAEEVAHERIAPSARLAALLIDHVHPDPFLPEALSTGEAVGEEIVERRPNARRNEKEAARVEQLGDGQDKEQRNAADQTVEALAEQTVGA